MAFDFNKGIPFQQQGVTPQKRPSISNIIEQEAAQKVKTGSLAEKIGFTNTKVGAAGQKVFNAFTSTAQKTGEVLGQDAAAPEAVNLYKNAAAEYEKTSNDMLETIRKAQSEGRDTTRLMTAFKTIKPPKMSDFVTPEMTQALEKTPEQIAGLVGGTALEALSGGAFQSGAKTVVSKAPVWMKLLRLTGESAGYGGVYGATQAMQENKDIVGIAKETGVNAAIGGAVGLTVGLGAAGIGAANKALVARRANQLVKASDEVDRLAGQIAQAKPDDIPAITRSLGEIDATDVKSYSDLAEAIDQQVEGLSTKLDDGLDTVVGTKTLDQLETTVTRGKTTIKSNPVAEALDQLEEFYISTNNKEKQAAISEIRRKAQTEGLTVKELNNLARLHGQDINAFYASGQAASGLTQQAAENTRKAIKSTARELFGNPLYAEVDQKISELLTTRTLVEKMVNSVQAIQNKVVPRNFTQKVGNAIANLIDTMSGGAAKSFIQRFVKSGNVNKVDALGLEKILQKNLKKMQELLKKSGTMSERDLIKELEQLNEQLLYPALPSGEGKPTGSFVPSKTIIMPSSAREVNSGMNEVKDATIKSTTINPKDKTEYVRNQKTGKMEIIPSKTQTKKKINNSNSESSLVDINLIKAGWKRTEIETLFDLSKGIKSKTKGPIIVNEKGEILDGAHRWLEAKKAGKTQIEVIRMNDSEFSNLNKTQLDKLGVNRNFNSIRKGKEFEDYMDENYFLKDSTQKKINSLENNIITEARKYKSAEEFVKSQGEKISTISSDQIISKGAKNQTIKEYSPSAVKYAEAQIKSGKGEPLMVSMKDGKFRLEDGEHRLEAYKNLGITDIPVRIKGDRAKSQLTDIWNKANKKPSFLGELKKKATGKEGQAGFAELFTNKGSNLTTKILKDLEGKTTVSKQYILDATNRGEMKQVDRELHRQVLETMKGDTINVKEFADKVNSELLPLKVNNQTNRFKTGGTKYENIALPTELRGNVKNYKENVYESPIKTSAGSTHFSGVSDNYFGHTRIEDMADNKTRRVIEVQSDLYQKGNLEREGATKAYINKDIAVKYDELAQRIEALQKREDLTQLQRQQEVSKTKRMMEEIVKKSNEPAEIARKKELSKLQQYNDPTAHFRMIREEIKKASQDGKTKLQFPTGETAMKIEGLGNSSSFQLIDEPYDNYDELADILNMGDPALLTSRNMKVGKTIYYDDMQTDYIITEVLGDGKFKAVPREIATSMHETSLFSDLSKAEQKAQKELAETFDISGKIDQNNPIYKFYEKDIQKYLNKYGGKKVIDDKGVSWIEIPITKQQGIDPVEAFGAVQLGAMTKIGIGTAIGAVGISAYNKLAKKFGVVEYDAESPVSTSDEETIAIPDRNIQISTSSIDDIVKPILFGELSNRPIEKKELEVRVILNTALNRIKQLKDKGKEVSLEEVLTAPNQYQAYDGEQYNNYISDELDSLGIKKKEELDVIMEKVLNELKAGTFKDNTRGAVFYVHEEDGRITFDSTKKLFK